MLGKPTIIVKKPLTLLSLISAAHDLAIESLPPFGKPGEVWVWAQHAGAPGCLKWELHYDVIDENDDFATVEFMVYAYRPDVQECNDVRSASGVAG